MALPLKRSQRFLKSSLKNFLVSSVDLYDNRDVMYMDPGDERMHCILVTTSQYREGILIEAEGYAYPRYAAFIPDCREIELAEKEILSQVDLSSNFPAEYCQEARAKKKNERMESR